MNIRNNQNKGRVLLLAASVVCAVLIIYFGMTIYFNSHIFTKTWFGDVKLSGCSSEGAKDKLNDMLSDYSLSIHGRDDMEEKVASKDIDLVYVLNGYTERIIEEQNPFAWPVHLFKKTEIEEKFEVEYDSEKLNSIIDNMDYMKEDNIVKPKDAYIADYQSGVGFELIPEVMGNELDYDRFMACINQALLDIKDEINVDEAGCYNNPEVLSSDEEIIEKEKYLNTFTNTKITYTFGEDTLVIDGDTVYEWMKIKKNGKVKIDEEKVRAFVDSMGSKYDTIFRRRVFKTHYGTEVTIDNGDYGWWMDRSTETNEIIKLIKKGEVVDREPAYFQKAVQYGPQDYGNTYVEINLTAQHLFLYKKGKVVLESDFVSGKATKDRQTPPGIFGITYKERDATLVGEDYETPVSYWMPFNGSVGMHDAIWRTKFGSNLYKGGGSHGCINLPFNVAAKIYDKIEKGTPVICYELPGTESKSLTYQSDEEIAQFVVDAIDRIGEVSKDRKLILEKFLPRTRKCYNELTYNQKRYVTNLSKLERAEKEFKELLS